MSDIRINALTTTASSSASDDYLPIDGSANGTRKLSAYSPTFGGNLTVNGTGTSSVARVLKAGTDIGAGDTSAFQVHNNVDDKPMVGFYRGGTLRNVLRLNTDNDFRLLSSDLSTPANLTASDLTLGTSGPSVKSTLSARAPRQGLVFDGSTSAVATVANVPAFGTSDFTVAAWVNKKDFAAAEVIFGGVTAGFELYVNSGDGKLRVIKIATAINGESTTAIQAGKWTLVTYTRSGGSAGTFYINGISAGTVTEGSPDYSAAVSKIGSDQSGAYFNGTIAEPLIYNRALSASEVVSLYEAGAPAGADYGLIGQPASNTSIITGDSSTFTSGVGNWTGFNGGSISAVGGKGVIAMASYHQGAANNTNQMVAGRRYRLTVTVSALAGGSYVLLTDYNSVEYASLTAGVNVVEFISRSNTGIAFKQGNSGTTSASVDDISLLPLGLLLAPDAAQAGGGLVWYDTSGNAANISWTSGVSWNVPSSRVLGGNWTTSGTLGVNKVAGGEASVASTLQITSPAVSETGAGGLEWKADVANNGYGFRTLPVFNGVSSYDLYTQSRSNSASWTTRTSLTNSGNLLIGTTTDSANGKLQLATHTTSAGGIGFGADTQIFRNGNNSLKLDAGKSAQQSSPGIVYLDNSFSSSTVPDVAGLKLNLYGAAAAGEGYGFGLGAAANLFIVSANSGGTGKIQFGTGTGTTALTLDSSQNATFAGNVAIQSGNSLRLNNPANSAYASLRLDASNIVQANYDWTFAGAIAIGNTVQTAASVASTHKVTISIGGTTYYLLATNV